MKHTDYWSIETNPETGAQFEYEKACLAANSNGGADIDKLIATEYGKMRTEEFERKLRFSTPDSPEAKEYLASFGVRKELHDDGNYYSRWCMCIPNDIANDSKEKYPLVIINAFNVNGAEFEFGFYRLAAKEHFLYMSAQNSNWESISQLIDTAAEMYPVDRERVYITGYSYMGYQSTGAFMHVPYKFAAAAPCGNDIFRPADNFLHPYTSDELASLRHFVVPFMQIVGQFEASNFVPLNDWHIRTAWGNPPRPEGLPPRYKDPRENQYIDPTINPLRRRPDGTIQATPPSSMPAPPEGMDRHIWMLSRLNKRLDLLKCAPRDMEKCISYLDAPADDLHHVLGFYGDRELTETKLGLRHWTVDIFNSDGIDAFRYTVVENHPHAVPCHSAEMLWPFFKQFRRDTATGRIVADEYKG